MRPSNPPSHPLAHLSLKPTVKHGVPPLDKAAAIAAAMRLWGGWAGL